MEEREVVLTQEEAIRKLQFLNYLNQKIAFVERRKSYEKWRKDGMWNAIKTGKILENTKKKRAALDALQNR